MSTDRLPQLADFPAIITLPVQWGDQDAFGHVNNVVYFRWCESARIAYFELSGMHALLGQQQLGPILARIACDYLRQLNFPDTIHVGARITRLGTKSLTMEHALYSQAQDAIVAKSESVIVCFHYESQASCPIPAEVRAQIERFEKKPLGSASAG
ncbi:MAG TPA: thioesterase family protein [Pirellulaceae bacterium]|nr:thioesterase family protein [Pirellulaceae bacterium]